MLGQFEASQPLAVTSRLHSPLALVRLIGYPSEDLSEFVSGLAIASGEQHQEFLSRSADAVTFG